MEHYTVEQAANLLGLHVKTVRAYVRDGRLKAARIGKQYRIARADLEEFTGLSLTPSATPRQAEASAVVHVDGVDRGTMDRVSTMVLSSLGGRPTGAHTQFVYDEEHGRLKVVILGDLETTARVLRLIDALIDQ
ncbi:helix-turn-helix domain-containing protein [Nonomuraea sp. MCN248]|uniref:Helix-turn-helix domain-containing protein n=1 Tax=Nonomuraea corallina TaxID=2989783 RepID=A0ABT4S5X3_9ACTN|nr:helix-turn-helix domain-containing protein [Nonomuraea corallina]MDA0632586.1 helix-turn-helix domain-containing protein [Nonomuraea corallina]